MAPRPTRSLKHEYELYVAREIEDYKESVPRAVLLGIGDEAVAVLAKQQQMALTELLLCEEVDRLIVRRIRVPSYTAWRKKRVKDLAELRRPEHWGLSAEDAVVRALRSASTRSQAQVLVAGMRDESHSLYLAANGCQVTALGEREEAIERVVEAAERVGLGDRLSAQVGDLASWVPDGPLTAVIVSPAALAALPPEARERAIAALQRATVDGGVHLLQALAAGNRSETFEDLRKTYSGWDVTIERGGGKPKTFLARKGAA